MSLELIVEGLFKVDNKFLVLCDWCIFWKWIGKLFVNLDIRNLIVEWVYLLSKKFNFLIFMGVGRVWGLGFGSWGMIIGLFVLVMKIIVGNRVWFFIFIILVFVGIVWGIFVFFMEVKVVVFRGGINFIRNLFLRCGLK